MVKRLHLPLTKERYGGLLSDMKERGIKCIHVYNIDDALKKAADHVFMGCCLLLNGDCGNK
eukprot:10428281-Ditylum_brightwellii.AAC.1